MRTLTRVAMIENALEGMLSSYSATMSELEAGRADVKKYFRYDKQRGELIMVSEHDEPDERYKYNCVLTVTSPSMERNIEIADDFEAKAGIKFRPAPKFLKKLMHGLSTLVELVEKAKDDLEIKSHVASAIDYLWN